ncbi:MAG TPA: OmpA family protein, partial [Paraburkholderia sp.]|nr:OmpA family protein [Paraburkholderia sp.]
MGNGQVTRMIQSGQLSGLSRNTAVQAALLQRKVDEESFARLGGKIEEVGDTRGGGFGEGSADSNEFLLWNYHVGRPEPQPQHTRYLAEKVLPPARWPDILRDDAGLNVAVVGGASSTGGASVATPLSVARAERIKAELVTGGIAPARIVTSGVGSRHPFADETSPENMARNRRVEVFLFRPTQRVTSLAGVTVKATNLSASVANGFSRDPSDPALLVLRWRPFTFSADV